MEKQEQANVVIPNITVTAKKSYCSPNLVEYGNIVAVTQAMMNGSFPDGGTVSGKQTMMMAGMG